MTRSLKRRMMSHTETESLVFPCQLSKAEQNRTVRHKKKFGRFTAAASGGFLKMFLILKCNCRWAYWKPAYVEFFHYGLRQNTCPSLLCIAKLCY